MNNRYREEEKELEEAQKVDENSENLEQKIEPEVEKEEIPTEEHVKPNKKIKKLEEEIKKQKEENNKLKEQYLRTLADAENFKKRIDEERIRERKYGSQRLLEKLVENLDIFDKAVNMKTDDVNLNNFLIGFKMINDNLKNVLSDEGVKKINSQGKFDPHYHHAVDTAYNEELEEDMIIEVIKDGYMYKDRVLTPALVKVNKKPVEDSNASQQE